MNISDLLTVEGIGWAVFSMGWIAQVYMSYAKRSTRISKKGLIFMMLGLLGVTISSWINGGFSLLVIVQILAVVMSWLVYARRR